LQQKKSYKGSEIQNSTHTRLLLTTSGREKERVREGETVTCAELSRGVSRECSPREESSHWLS